MRAVVRGAVHSSSHLLRCVYYLRFVKNRVCFTFINFVRRDVFINNYTYVQYTTKYMKIENKYIFPVLMVLLSLLFIFYIHNLIPFFLNHDLITFSKNYTAKDPCLQNKSRQKRTLTIPTFQLYI